MHHGDMRLIQLFGCPEVGSETSPFETQEIHGKSHGKNVEKTWKDRGEIPGSSSNRGHSIQRIYWNNCLCQVNDCSVKTGTFMSQYVMDITGYPISRIFFLVKPAWIVDFFHANSCILPLISSILSRSKNLFTPSGNQW